MILFLRPPRTVSAPENKILITPLLPIPTMQISARSTETVEPTPTDSPAELPLPPHDGSLVSLETWFASSPRYAAGLIVNYGAVDVVEATADYRGYDLSLYPERCGVSLISPSDLGKIVWVRIPPGEWYGPCLSIDAGARHDFFTLVYRNHEVAEVARPLATLLGFEHGMHGEVYIGLCPPPDPGQPEPYAPALTWSDEPLPRTWRWHQQQMPVDCERLHCILNGMLW